jgi:histidinol-phosphate/aromatic aminotransferase/cobyric acid decarboxylase-like protein
VTIHRGAANFVLVESALRDAIVEYLKSNRVLVRPMSAEPLQSMFRMSFGTFEEMQRFVAIFTRFLEMS